MPTYQYKARDKFGKLATGLLDAEAESSVAVKLKEMGYIPVTIAEAQKISAAGGDILGKFKKIGLSDLCRFTREFAVLQRASITALSSLISLKEESTNLRLKDIIGKIARDIEAGSSLSAAFAKYPGVFNPLYVNMVKAGEVSGSLDQSLDKLASLLEFEEKVHMRIKAATRYPLIVVCAIFIGFMILTTLIVPRFANIYSQFQTALPLPTRILLGLNVAITKYWWLSGLCIAVFIFAFKKLINTKAGRLHWDGFKLKVPIFGPLVFKLIMARFTRITGTLMKSGVGLLEILDLASSGVGNEVIARTIKAIKKSVSEGRGLSEPMRQSKMFPAAVIQMVSVGEQTGKLDELLIHVSGYYDAQAEYTINNLTSLIEPVLILILGCAVLFMALGIFLPMWNMMNLFRG